MRPPRPRRVLAKSPHTAAMGPCTRRSSLEQEWVVQHAVWKKSAPAARYLEGVFARTGIAAVACAMNCKDPVLRLLPTAMRPTFYGPFRKSNLEGHIPLSRAGRIRSSAYHAFFSGCERRGPLQRPHPASATGASPTTATLSRPANQLAIQKPQLIVPTWQSTAPPARYAQRDSLRARVPPWSVEQHRQRGHYWAPYRGHG